MNPRDEWITGLDFSGLDGPPDDPATSNSGRFREVGEIRRAVTVDADDPADRAAAAAAMAEQYRAGHIILSAINAQEQGEHGWTDDHFVKMVVNMAGWHGWDEQDYERAGEFVPLMFLADETRDAARAGWMAATMMDAMGEGEPDESIAISQGLSMLSKAAHLSRTLWRIQAPPRVWSHIAEHITNDADALDRAIPCECSAEELAAGAREMSQIPHDQTDSPRCYSICSYTMAVYLIMAQRYDGHGGFSAVALGSGLALPSKGTMAHWLRKKPKGFEE